MTPDSKYWRQPSCPTGFQGSYGSARCGDSLLAVTKAWLKEPSTVLNRPTFETCLETGELTSPRTARL